MLGNAQGNRDPTRSNQDRLEEVTDDVPLGIENVCSGSAIEH